MWNDTETPLALFLTFRTYGTWLHGDDPGSIDRNNNLYRSPRILASSNWRKYNEQLLLHPPFVMDASCRKSVDNAIREGRADDVTKAAKRYLEIVAEARRNDENGSQNQEG